VIGPRALTRGLFLDRRAFLTDYDCDLDPDGAALGRLLGATVPVSLGINLSYFFSCVDPKKYGCGSKLPQNIAGLLGVMDGHQSDLRTGLVWQTVEFHEPIRLLNIIRARPEVVMRVLEENPTVWQLTRHEWLKLAVLHPETGALSVFERGALRAYTPERERVAVVERSARWFEGRRDTLPFALIERR
jgi:uncharacterized protein YbcC (UPF0753/DUF2309 family)